MSTCLPRYMLLISFLEISTNLSMGDSDFEDLNAKKECKMSSMGEIHFLFRASFVKHLLLWGNDEEGEDVDVHLYRSMIGCLMYLTASRPDIMFAVCIVLYSLLLPEKLNSQLKNKSFDEVQSLTRTIRLDRLFLLYGSEVLKGDDDQEEAEMKNHMEIVIDEEEIAVDTIPLATKPPVIVDWKIVKEGKMGYF
ncbi:hypothetical protein Tco_0553142 [Tanacetum coccineum]